jgi:drug/metabolite transporter (DMT)-like permease
MRGITNRTWHDLLVVASAVSAGVHAALVPEHVQESAATGAGFIASAVLLAALVVALTIRPGDRRVVASAGLTLVGLLVLYGLATTSGVPVLQPEPEAVDGLALATKAIELAGVLAAAALVPFSTRQPQGATT